jgi:hypothetical protein
VTTDIDQAAKAMRDEEMLAEIEDFIEGFNQPTYRGMRVNGQRVATWSSQDGWSGVRGPRLNGSNNPLDIGGSWPILKPGSSEQVSRTSVQRQQAPSDTRL